MTRRPKVWEPRAGTSGGEEMPEWEVSWFYSDPKAHSVTGTYVTTSAPHALDAWLQVPGAPAFGSCRVRKIEQEKIDNESK